MKKKNWNSTIKYIVGACLFLTSLVACGVKAGKQTEEVSLEEQTEVTVSEDTVAVETVSVDTVTYVLSDEPDKKVESVSAPEINLANYNEDEMAIPALYITTANGYGIESRDMYVSGNMIYEGKQYEADFRGRGNASWTKFAQRSYMIKLAEKESLIDGAVKARRWVLISNFMDYSMMRNPVAQCIAKRLDGMEFGIGQQPVDVFINGVYEGVYILSEKIEEGKGKVNLFSNAEDYPYDPAKAVRYGDLEDSEKMAARTVENDDVAFFFEAGYDLYESHTYGLDQFITRHSTTLILQYPEFTVANNPEALAIQNYLNEMEKAFLSKENIFDYIDKDSWVDWFITMEITNNTDSSFCRSTFFYKRPGEKVMLGPVWDFDMAYGNYGLEDNSYSSWCTGEPRFVGNQNHWMTDLLACDEFMLAVRQRWDEIHETFLDDTYSEIEMLGQEILPSRGFHQSLYGRGGWDSTESLKNFVTKRFNWIEQSIYMGNFNRKGIPYSITIITDEEGNQQIVTVGENGTTGDTVTEENRGENQLGDEEFLGNDVIEIEAVEE